MREHMLRRSIFWLDMHVAKERLKSVLTISRLRICSVLRWLREILLWELVMDYESSKMLCWWCCIWIKRVRSISNSQIYCLLSKNGPLMRIPLLIKLSKWLIGGWRAELKGLLMIWREFCHCFLTSRRLLSCFRYWVIGSSRSITDEQKSCEDGLVIWIVGFLTGEEMLQEMLMKIDGEIRIRMNLRSFGGKIS